MEKEIQVGRNKKFRHGEEENSLKNNTKVNWKRIVFVEECLLQRSSLWTHIE